VTAEPTRLRVAYFVPPSPHFAGVELVVHEIASGLMELAGGRLDVHVIYSTPYDDRRLVDTPYRLHVLDTNRLRYLAPKLRATVADLDIDVLISAQVEPSVLSWAATRGLRLPVFVTHLHGNPQVEESMGSRRTRLAFRLFRRFISPRTDAVLTVAPALSRYVAAEVSPRTPVHFVKNPAREIGGSEELVTATTGPFRFVNIARLSHQKGLDTLLRSFALARPALPESTLTLVGSGPDEAALKALSQELGLDDVVTFAGYTSEPDYYLRRADCFVLSSRWEGFPLVLLEALRFGLPLLAADCDFGPGDLITDPRIGELVAPDDPEALAEGMVRMAAARRSDPATATFRRVTAAGYSRGAAARMHLEVLREIVATHRPRTGRMAAFLDDTAASSALATVDQRPASPDR
jgi:glycosyltransferase involved in cell wall biosynthesis